MHDEIKDLVHQLRDMVLVNLVGPVSSSGHPTSGICFRQVAANVPPWHPKQPIHQAIKAGTF